MNFSWSIRLILDDEKMTTMTEPSLEATQKAFWLLHAAQELNVDPNFDMWPDQYRWAVSRRSNIIKFKKM